MTELAMESGTFIKPLFGQIKIAVEMKSDQTPVTAADRGAEELMRGMIAKRYPAHGVIGEELGSDRAESEFVWVLDPVDGTKSFITGVPLWGYFCQISDSTTSYGSYSGAVPNEKITWGKLSADTPKYIIESDATIVAPLIFACVLEQ